MFLRKKCRYGSRKLQFLSLLLMLGFLLLMVTTLNPPPSHQSKEGTFQPVEFNPREGYQVDFVETQEMLETQEESQQYYPLDGLSPFISLREDELIAAIVSPAAKRNHSKARKGYRMVRQQSKRLEAQAKVKAEGDPESQLIALPLRDGKGADAGERLLGLETHGFNEALSERLSLRRELPEVRHPLNSVVSPIIDVIDWKTFQYYHSVGLHRGVFDWKLDFHWEPVPDHEEKVRQSPISPIRSPVVAGAVVAMDRHYFQNTGAYDSDMTLWGAENLELSIRTWLCGGSVEIIPCSRVGHVYRNHFPHAFSYEEAIVRNKIRIAETWLGSFKENFYNHNTVAFLISKAEKPDCSERLQLQNRLGCRNFHWFISNVYPELSQPEDPPKFSGKLYNTGVDSCANYRPGRAIEEGSIELSPCSDSLTQRFEYNSMKEIRLGSAPLLCFDVRHGKVIPQNCTKERDNSQQHWDVQENGMIVHILSGKCIEAVKSEDGKDMFLCACNKNSHQLWQFEHSHVPDQR
ncbi:polypeptide N-acetylgalactosaminyltransferase 15 isoform X2 [Struthio camelus]|uniref:polypeptide N-acetylgalactosaminyltransferase 15 isoform X2 n=1 Tax=Struthio camelus TaxID=8801 RepID=UPI00360420E7